MSEMTAAPTADVPRVPAQAGLAERYRQVRAVSDWISADVSPEDATVQSMTDASPVKWHLAHTTWFFETFVLERAQPDGQPFHPAFRVLFNSYYNGVGEQHHRPERGLITRPGLDEVRAYRAHVDRRMAEVLEGGVDDPLAAVVEVGLHHEQQHQELMLMDFKHLLSRNPLLPTFRDDAAQPEGGTAPEHRWLEQAGGVVEIGHAGDGFHFDNEGPRHETLLRPYAIGSRLVTNGEYLEFVEAGGYANPLIWLSDGWATVEAEGWKAPLYWLQRDGAWHQFTLGGVRPLALDEPVVHVSYYEAMAYAAWREARLPTEAEWEAAAPDTVVEGNTMARGRLHPAVAGDDDGQWFGDTWEWTSSPYVAYPGFRPLPGALGEYNGKFMCNQHVLRGGCCATPEAHLRATYRNFFYPSMRWQYGGIRLARDL